MGSSRWLSTDEIAEYLGVKRDTIYKWIERHDLPAHKVGRLWKFRRQEIDTWIVSGNQHRDYAATQAHQDQAEYSPN
ncbi:MAG: helix-turn-helix domain-containing protein [Chloroflexota bacterium]